MDVAGEMLGENLEVRFLALYSPEAVALGAELAPALVVNRRTLVEGVPSVEEIKALLEKARPVRLGIILTKAPQGSEDAENALEAGLAALDAGDEASLFLLSDGVWAARKDAMAGRLPSFVGKGGKVLVSGEHMKAAGLAGDKLVEQAQVANDVFDDLVDLVMGQWDRVIVF
ncbi:MAG: DsrE family protein [Dehalococcoidia bacterium]|nr:DsrE family protein [Dehalococcoidia bacterium]